MMPIEHLTLLMKLLCEVFFTLAVLSFLYRDNPIYRFAEHFFVGVAAAFSQAQLWAFLDVTSYPILVVGVICCLVYFFFSKEHRGATGAVALIGIWFLMVSFGASYGRTVATRVSLFLERATFLLTDTTLIGGRPFQNWKITALVAAPMVGFLVAYFGVLRRGEEQGEGEGS